MKSWTVVIWLVVSQLAELGCGKRFDPAMVDPLMRRSSLDKNFMRFGRSSPSYEDKDEVDEASPGEDTSKDDSFLRSMRGKDNFMRFGRGRNENYMRFGRGKQDSFMRFGRARNDNYMRFGRGRENNMMRFGRGKQDFMRFGRGKEDNYMRFGRGKEDNYMRFGRGKQDNFMRFGKGATYGKQDSFMRLGRGKDNFMRFGRDFVSLDNSGLVVDPLHTDDAALRIARGRQNNLIRFGKKSEEDSLIDDPFDVQSGNSKQNFLRITRGKQDNFMRFGKSDNGKSSLEVTEESADFKDPSDSQNNIASVSDVGFPSEIQSKHLSIIRLDEHPGANNAYLSYGGNSQTQPEDSMQPSELIPQRLKRSVPSYDEGNRDHVTLTASPEELEEEYVTPLHQEDYSSRKKRSLVHHGTSPPPIAEDSSVVDYISAKLRLRSSQPEYESSLLSAGLPNVIVGPEFSLLPDLDPPASMLKRARPGDKSFLRLG